VKIFSKLKAVLKVFYLTTTKKLANHTSDHFRLSPNLFLNVWAKQFYFAELYTFYSVDTFVQFTDIVW